MCQQVNLSMNTRINDQHGRRKYFSWNFACNTGNSRLNNSFQGSRYNHKNSVAHGPGLCTAFHSGSNPYHQRSNQHHHGPGCRVRRSFWSGAADYSERFRGFMVMMI
jgi:hypothetical protein